MRGLLACIAASGMLMAAVAGATDTRGLERRCRAFYDLLARGDRAQATRTWPGLERDVSSALERVQDELDSMREAVIDRDGDLEALYRSERWREPDVASLVLTYHLAWVRYQGAQLTSDRAQRRRLLRQAVEGFSHFTIVEDVAEIYAESLYGRGLAFMDLGEHRNAIADLEAAAALPRTAGKARSALAEARRLAAGGAPRKAPDPEQLLGRLRALLPRAAAGDRAAEREATDLARGLAARAGAWPAKVDAAVRETLADRSSFGLLLRGRLAIDRTRCADVPALARAGADVHDDGRDRLRPELLYLEAGCALNGGDARLASELFAALLAEFPRAGVAADAAYYRVRALATAVADDGTLDGVYREAAGAFIDDFPDDARAAEVRYLLAEHERGRGACDRARPLYAAVGAGAWAVRARLGSLECEVASLGGESAAVDRARVLEALRAFARETPAEGPDAQAVARAVLLAALLAASGEAPDHGLAAELLDEYETRFPGQTEWHAMAVEVRLESLLLTDRLPEAERDLEVVLRRDLDADTRRLLTRIGNDLVRRAERDATPEARQAAGLARRVWRALAADEGDPAARLRLAELELRAGNATQARQLYEDVLATTPASAEARRGAARTAAATGDTTTALAHWRALTESSPVGGTAWYEARLAEIELLATSGRRAEACRVLRASRHRSTTTGGDVLAAQLAAREPEVCR